MQERFEGVLEECTVTFADGDLFALFTDGITEAMNEDLDLFGEDRLCGLLEEHARSPLEMLGKRIVGDVAGWGNRANVAHTAGHGYVPKSHGRILMKLLAQSFPALPHFIRHATCHLLGIDSEHLASQDHQLVFVHRSLTFRCRQDRLDEVGKLSSPVHLFGRIEWRLHLFDLIAKVSSRLFPKPLLIIIRDHLFR